MEDDDATIKSWWIDDAHRRDGIRVAPMPGIDEAYMIIGHGVSIELCPCCERRMATQRAARLVADLVYPMRSH
jgi:hypothetical protein